MNEALATPIRSLVTMGSQATHAVTRSFDWTMIILGSWFLGGLFLDGWAHTHGKADESFFTPWHAVLYSGHLATLLYLSAQWLRRRALPTGYGLSLGGALIFLVGGVGDFVWHELFGIERSIEALLSPTHLLLAFGLALVVSGPLRAAWQRPIADLRTLREQLPMVLSLTFMLSIFTFFTQFAHPTANAWGVGAVRAPVEQELGVTSILLDTALLMGAILFILRRWPLAPGALTLIFALNAGLMGFVFDQGPYPLQHLIVRSVAALIAELLLARWQPTPRRRLAWYSFAFVTPTVLYLLYFSMAHIVAGIAWTIHLWAGVAVLAGVVGFLISLMAAPPDAQFTAE